MLWWQWAWVGGKSLLKIKQNVGKAITTESDYQEIRQSTGNNQTIVFFFPWIWSFHEPLCAASLTLSPHSRPSSVLNTIDECNRNNWRKAFLSSHWCLGGSLPWKFITTRGQSWPVLLQARGSPAGKKGSIPWNMLLALHVWFSDIITKDSWRWYLMTQFTQLYPLIMRYY